MTTEEILNLSHVHDVCLNVVKKGKTYRLGGQQYFEDKFKLKPHVEDENGSLRPVRDDISVTVLYTTQPLDASDGHLCTTYASFKTVEEAESFVAEVRSLIKQS